MSSLDGYIKFKQDFIEDTLLTADDVESINRFRSRIYKLGLVGVYGADDPDFAGIGFGNVSKRVGKGTGFLITGSATGRFSHLGPDKYALVQYFDIDGNYVQSTGGTPASSESLTHAAVYSTNPDAKWVVHGHHRGLWERWQELGMKTTPENVEYGTPGMARAVQKVVEDSEEETLVAMLGHKDGILIWGSEADKIIQVLSEALGTD